MAVRRRIGAALKGFADAFGPLYQQQQYYDRLARGDERAEAREKRVARREDIADVTGLLEAEAGTFPTRWDFDEFTSGVAEQYPGLSPEEIGRIGDSLFPTDVERQRQVRTNIGPTYLSVDRDRLVRELEQVGGRPIPGVSPGMVGPVYPPELAPLEALEAQQASDLASEEATLRRQFDLKQEFESEDTQRDLNLRHAVAQRQHQDRIDMMSAEAQALGDIASAQALKDYAEQMRLTEAFTAEHFSEALARDVARETSIYAAMSPLQLEQEAARLEQRLQDDMLRLDEPYVRAEGRRAATIEEAVNAIRLKDEMVRMNPDGPYQAAFLKDLEKRTALQLYMNQGAPTYAIEFDTTTGEPKYSLMQTRGPEGNWRWTRMASGEGVEGFYPLLHPELAAAATAGLDTAQIMSLMGGTPGGTPGETGAGPPGAPGVDPAAGQGDLWGLGDDTAYGGPGAPVRLTPTGPQWQFGAFPMATAGVSPMRGGKYVGGGPSAWLDPEGALAMEISQYQSGLVDLERETEQLSGELEVLQTTPNLPPGYALAKQAELEGRLRTNAELQAQLNARMAEVSAWFQAQ